MLQKCIDLSEVSEFNADQLKSNPNTGAEREVDYVSASASDRQVPHANWSSVTNAAILETGQQQQHERSIWWVR